MHIFSVNHSLRGGYLPESAPFITNDWEDARNYLIDEISGHSGRRDFYFEGLRQEVIDLLDNFDSVGNFFKYAELFQVDILSTFDITDDEVKILSHIVECEDATDELQALDKNDTWSGYVENTHFWMESINPADVGIHHGMSDDELEQKLYELNNEPF